MAVCAGSVMDMEYSATVSGGVPNWKREYSQKPNVYKGTAGGRAIQFGAASDDQTAADTNKLSGSVSTGAATFSFIQVTYSLFNPMTHSSLYSCHIQVPCFTLMRCQALF